MRPAPIIEICKKCQNCDFAQLPNALSWYCSLRGGEGFDDFFLNICEELNSGKIIKGSMEQIPENCSFSLEHLYEPSKADHKNLPKM